MSGFDLERRAEELLPNYMGRQPNGWPETCGARYAREGAIQLAREALEAAAKECERRAHPNQDCSCAAIIRSFIEKPGSTVGIAAHGRPAAPEVGCAPASGVHSLSDAEILERAAEIMYARHFSGTGGQLCDEAAKLRAAEEVDVFDAFQSGYNEHNLEPLEDRAREWFGPLVSALERIACKEKRHGGKPKLGCCVARDALSALRARARAAGGGR